MVKGGIRAIFVIRQVCTKEKTDGDAEEDQKKRKRGKWLTIRMGWFSCDGANPVSRGVRHWLYQKVIYSERVPKVIRETVDQWSAKEVIRDKANQIAENNDRIEQQKNKREKMERQQDAMVKKQLDHISRIGEEDEHVYLEHSTAFADFFARYDKTAQSITVINDSIQDMEDIVEILEQEKHNLEFKDENESVPSNSLEGALYASRLKNKNDKKAHPIKEDKEAYALDIEQKQEEAKEKRLARKNSKREDNPEDRKSQLIVMLLAAKAKQQTSGSSGGGGRGGSSYRHALDDEDDIIVSVPPGATGRTRAPIGAAVLGNGSMNNEDVSVI